MKQKLKILVSSTLISLLLCFSSFADDRKLPRPPVEATNTLAINWAILNLSNTQKEKMRLMNLDFQRMSIRVKAEIDLKQLEIEKLLISPYSSSDQIRKIMREKLILESKLRMEALENFLQRKALLTTDQLAKLPSAASLR